MGDGFAAPGEGPAYVNCSSPSGPAERLPVLTQAARFFGDGLPREQQRFAELG
jgi:hypothetical protein